MMMTTMTMMTTTMMLTAVMMMMMISHNANPAASRHRSTRGIHFLLSSLFVMQLF